MSSSVIPDSLPDARPPTAGASVRRKPPPAALGQRPSSSPGLGSFPHQHLMQQANQSFHISSFSEKYPDPDPTDPFAPLWVLRNRTSSLLHREGAPDLARFLQARDTNEFGLRQPDRRRSISYLQTYVAASTRSEADGGRPTCTSDHGHGVVSVRVQRACSIDDSGNRVTSKPSTSGNTSFSFFPTTRRQSTKPTPLSQMMVPTASLASQSSGSCTAPVTPNSPRVVQLPSIAGDDSSGTESDITRIGVSVPSDVEATPRAAAQPSYYRPHDHPPPQQQLQQQRTRASSANKLTRFLKTGKMSQLDENPHIVRAPVMDVSRIRKASISPPIFSTAAWAGQGGDFAPIRDHPLQKNAISIVAATPSISDAPTSTPQSIPTSDSGDLVQQDVTSRPRLPSTLPALVSRPLTSLTYTDESHSGFSYVHIPTTQSSPFLAQLVASQAATGPELSAAIASPATLKFKRSTSRPTSKFPPSLGHLTSFSPLRKSRTLTIDTSFGTLEQFHPARSGSGEWDIPTLHSLTKAASLPIIAESGVRITFGTLFAQHKVVVVFIRHFWCPLCQDYMISVSSLTRQLRPEDILGSLRYSDRYESTEILNDKVEKREPIKLVVIGNGSYTMIGKYKQMFGSGATPLDVYTDPSLAVYAALGLGKDPTSIPEHRHSRTHGRSKSNVGPSPRLEAEVLHSSYESSCSVGDSERAGSKSGGYVKHGLMGGIAMVFVRALKVGMPVWGKGGDLNQLGGEFVFGPGLVCTYAHRMQTTKGHAPFQDVLRAAGIVLPDPPLKLPLSIEDFRDEKRKGKQDDDKKSLRKSRGRVRGQTIDAVPRPTLRVHTAPPMPTSASLPHASNFLQSGAEIDNDNVIVVGRKQSQRKRRSNGRMSPVIATSFKPRTAPESTAPFTQPATLEVPISPISTTSILAATGHLSSSPDRLYNDASGDTRRLPFISRKPISPLSIDLRPDLEMKWIEEGHRSLQKIKEKKLVRRGMNQFDGRQTSANSISTSVSKPRSKSTLALPQVQSRTKSSRRTPSSSLSTSGSRSMSNSLSQVLASSSSVIAVSSTSTTGSRNKYYKRSERRTSKTSARVRRSRNSDGKARAGDAERAVESDTGVLVTRREKSARRASHMDRRVVCGNGGHAENDIAFPRREGRMNRVINLSRDRLTRQEDRTTETGVEVAEASGDAETVSDKALVHQ